MVQNFLEKHVSERYMGWRPGSATSYPADDFIFPRLRLLICTLGVLYPPTGVEGLKEATWERKLFATSGKRLHTS